MRRMHAVHEEDFLIVLQGFLELLVPHDPRFLRLAIGLGGNADWFVICEAVLFQPLRQTAYAVRDAERFLQGDSVKRREVQPENRRRALFLSS